MGRMQSVNSEKTESLRYLLKQRGRKVVIVKPKKWERDVFENCMAKNILGVKCTILALAFLVMCNQKSFNLTKMRSFK